MRANLLNPSINVGTEYRLEYHQTIFRENTLCEETYRASVVYLNNQWTVDETLTIRTLHAIK